jgi:hypothetical protein
MRSTALQDGIERHTIYIWNSEYLKRSLTFWRSVWSFRSGAVYKKVQLNPHVLVRAQAYEGLD